MFDHRPTRCHWNPTSHYPQLAPRVQILAIAVSQLPESERQRVKMIKILDVGCCPHLIECKRLGIMGIEKNFNWLLWRIDLKDLANIWSFIGLYWSKSTNNIDSICAVGGSLRNKKAKWKQGGYFQRPWQTSFPVSMVLLLLVRTLRRLLWFAGATDAIGAEAISKSSSFRKRLLFSSCCCKTGELSAVTFAKDEASFEKPCDYKTGA